MAADAAYANVSLLLHGDGANNSTTFTDNSSAVHTATRYGTAAISTTQSKWGGASIRTPGGSCVLFADTNICDFVAGDFTIEFWVRADGVTTQAFLNNYATSSATSTFVIQCNGSGVIGAYAYTGSSSISCVSAASTLVSATWQHIAFVRSGSNFYLFVDGVQKATTTSAATLNTGAAKTRVGAESDTGASGATAYFDDVRITKGVARYTASFTPPTEAFASLQVYITGNVKNDANANVARTVRAYRRDTGVLSGSTVSDGTTGNFSIITDYAGEHTVIALDDDAGTAYNVLAYDRVVAQ